MKQIPSLVMLLVVASALCAAGQGTGTRRFVSSGRPLVEQLRPTDREVVVEINESRPLTLAPPTGEARAASVARHADLMVVVRAVTKTPQLVRRSLLQNTPAAAAQANWIGSRIEARVERVIKASGDLPLEAGTLLVFDDNSGVATLGNTRVETVVPWERPIVAGRRYLLGGSVRDGMFVRGLTYEEDDSGLLKSMLRQVPGRPDAAVASAVASEADEFEEWTIDRAAQEFEAVANR
jgi:hypothetical protein